jgi:hypothetical protein
MHTSTHAANITAFLLGGTDVKGKKVLPLLHYRTSWFTLKNFIVSVKLAMILLSAMLGTSLTKIKYGSKYKQRNKLLSLSFEVSCKIPRTRSLWRIIY